MLGLTREQVSRHTGVVTGGVRGFRSYDWLAFLAGAILLAVWPGGFGHGRVTGDLLQMLVLLAVWRSAYTFVSDEPSFSPRRWRQVLWGLVAALLAGGLAAPRRSRSTRGRGGDGSSGPRCGPLWCAC